MAVFAYVATSTPDLELLQQREKVEDHARQFELHVDRVFADSNVAKNVPLHDRPAGGKLLASLKTGGVVLIGSALAFASQNDLLHTFHEWTKQGILPHLLWPDEPAVVPPEFCKQTADVLEEILLL